VTRFWNRIGRTPMNAKQYRLFRVLMWAYTVLWFCGLLLIMRIEMAWIAKLAVGLLLTLVCPEPGPLFWGHSRYLKLLQGDASSGSDGTGVPRSRT